MSVQANPIDALLKTKDLCVEFRSDRLVRAVDGVSLDVSAGEIIGLVGESGSGKTVFSLSLLRLIPPPGRITRGKVLWRGKNVLEMSEQAVRALRGREIAMIFQNPQASLNPARTVGEQVASVIRLHHDCDRRTAQTRALEWLAAVRIAEPERVFESYPHECSGGMCQRAMIAMALACQPKLLIADEPTASLDVTIQAQLMDLLLEIREKYGMAILLVSHDLGVIARMCDRISVMYRGRIVELADALDLYARPQHPYTRLLLESVPVADPSKRPDRGTAVETPVRSVADTDRGCPFGPRCPEAEAVCTDRDPQLQVVNVRGQEVACFPRHRVQDDESRRNSPAAPDTRMHTSCESETSPNPWSGWTHRV